MYNNANAIGHRRYVICQRMAARQLSHSRTSTRSHTNYSPSPTTLTKLLTSAIQILPILTAHFTLTTYTTIPLLPPLHKTHTLHMRAACTKLPSSYNNNCALLNDHAPLTPKCLNIPQHPCSRTNHRRHGTKANTIGMRRADIALNPLLSQVVVCNAEPRAKLDMTLL